MPKNKKKKARVNYRMLTIVGLLVVIGLGIIGGLLFLRLKGTLIGIAPPIILPGWRHEEGRGYFGRVLKKQPGNLEATNKLMEVWSQTYPDTPQQANEMYRQYLQLCRHAHSQFGEEEATASRVLEEHYRSSDDRRREFLEVAWVADNIINRLREHGRCGQSLLPERGVDSSLEDESSPTTLMEQNPFSRRIGSQPRRTGSQQRHRPPSWHSVNGSGPASRAWRRKS